MHPRGPYESALIQFGKVQVWNVALGNVTDAFKGLTRMQRAALRHIRITAPTTTEEIVRDSGLAKKFREQFHLTPIVETVDFSFITRMENGPDAIRLMTEFPAWLPAFTQLKYFSVEISVPDSILDEDGMIRVMEPFFDHIDDTLGVWAEYKGSNPKEFGFVRHYEEIGDEDEIVPSEDHNAGGEDDEVRNISGTVERYSWTAEKKIL